MGTFGRFLLLDSESRRLFQLATQLRHEGCELAIYLTFAVGTSMEVARHVTGPPLRPSLAGIFAVEELKSRGNRICTIIDLCRCTPVAGPSAAPHGYSISHGVLRRFERL